MKQAQGITEQLKAENALEWTGRMNNIRACAREIVEEEIFSKNLTLNIFFDIIKKYIVAITLSGDSVYFKAFKS